MLKIFILFAATLCVAAARERSVPFAGDVDTPDGGFRFDITLCAKSDILKRDVPDVHGSMRNQTGTRWRNVSFRILFNHDGKPVSIPIEFRSFIDVGVTVPVSRTLIEFSDCNFDSIRVEYNGGVSTREEEIAQAAVERRDAQARKRATEAATRRAAYVATLPLISSGGESLFLGSDRKCAEQFQQALTMDGLEKRKRMAELVSFGCGLIVSSPARATLGKRDGSYVRVTIKGGTAEGKSGWVPALWLK